ncbi:putative GTP-binding protein [Blattabacterium sp. (Blattella germanica) str. Bge]|uniref:GTPase Era n=1 Tax=Blattabacterium sp. (Blattella germanica) TaxID=624186 RepID=UPI0001BB62E0|nr:GTPase Era [Blattabacterium sp. (Blattella germanica)]ACY40096.1 putative GTP-binding protein [Blattabacterium sp. (Blattella germanica) str. Bge]
MIHKSGFVNIIGFPNTGKSTLMNSLVGEKLSITTYKPQTTRHRILGIINESNFQIIFSDTPGIIDPVYPMQKIMMQYVEKALEDADIILFLTEIGKLENIPIFNEIKKTNVPIIILINKIDQIGIKYREYVLYDAINHWHKLFPNSEILPISALKKMNQDLLMNKIIDLLSEHPPYYSKEFLSNRSKRFFVNEIIREKYFFIQKEIPYSVEINTILFKKEKTFIYILSYIYVERNSQKGILIGKRGDSLKKLKFFSIKSIESFLRTKIKLNLYVKVSPYWRYDYKKLKFFGY